LAPDFSIAMLPDRNERWGEGSAWAMDGSPVYQVDHGQRTLFESC
jgi:hypothetical protein